MRLTSTDFYEMKKFDWISLNLAAFTDDTGKLKSPFLISRLGLWIPPSVEIRDRRLVYPVPKDWLRPAPSDIGILGTVGFYALEDHRWKHTPATDTHGLLDAFVSLANANDASIKKFASRWGPLWHCTKHKDCLWQP
jgi:hypothetical protein